MSDDYEKVRGTKYEDHYWYEQGVCVMKPDITIMGIPIVFDETVPEDTFYIVSTSLGAERQRVLDRILAGVRESTRGHDQP